MTKRSRLMLSSCKILQCSKCKGQFAVFASNIITNQFSKYITAFFIVMNSLNTHVMKINLKQSFSHMTNVNKMKREVMFRDSAFGIRWAESERICSRFPKLLV